MTIDDVLTSVIDREGGFVNDPVDKGGPTNMGVTAATLGDYRKLGRWATVDEVRNLGEPEVRAIYFERYVRQPRFEALPEWLLPAVVDDAVLSGPRTAITTLQQVLKVVADGEIGPLTLHALAAKDPAALRRELVTARALRFARIVELNPSQVRFLRGWLARALSFL